MTINTVFPTCRESTGNVPANLNSLADWAITAIDYNNGRYEYDSSLRTSDNGLALIKRYVSANGTGYASAQTLTLEASNQGIRYTPVGAGIRIDDSSGSSEIIITQIVSDSVTLPPVHSPPRLNSALADLTVDEDNAISWQVPAGAFVDANPTVQGFTVSTEQQNQTSRFTTKNIALCARSITVVGQKAWRIQLQSASASSLIGRTSCPWNTSCGVL
jgi:hypothetical protein